MKRNRFFLVAVICFISATGSILTADDDDDKIFGNGRFLRRMRKEFSSQKDAASKKPKKKSTTSKGKTPTLAPSPNSRPKSRTNAGPEKLPVTASRSAKEQTLGFGMLIETRGASMVVTALNREGNAAQAGVQSGDVIQGVGGVNIETLEEFNEITSILGNGDQLEFQIARKGKTQKILIQFGVAPKEGDFQSTTQSQSAKSNTVVPVVGPPILQSPSTNGLHSVMSQPVRDEPTSQSRTASRIESGTSSNRNQQIIQNQQSQIKRLQSEIQKLRRKPTKASTSGRTLLNRPKR